MLSVNRRGRGAETRQIVVPRSVQFQIDASMASRAGEAVAAARDVKDGSTAWTAARVLIYCAGVVFRLRTTAAGCRLLTSCPSSLQWSMRAWIQNKCVGAQRTRL